MKNWIPLFLCLTLLACRNNESTTPKPVSTVDSNLAEPNDTLLPGFYIDNATGDTTFSIALDSPSQAILPDDTNYVKQD